jgi:hypothetical protein
VLAIVETGETGAGIARERRLRVVAEEFVSNYPPLAPGGNRIGRGPHVLLEPADASAPVGEREYLLDAEVLLYVVRRHSAQ